MRRVLVQFLDFKLEHGVDILYIGTISNPRILAYSDYPGFETSNALIISPINESLQFEFMPDDKTTDQGFSLLLTDVGDRGYILCRNGLEITRDSFNCYDCPSGEIQLPLNASVTIQSPGYPAYYSNNIGCEWIITPSSMRRVHMQFLDLKLEPGVDILYAGTIHTPRVLVYSGYLGHEASDIRIISPTNEGLLFEFITDGRTTDQGFSLLFTDVKVGGKKLM
ncbi:astacin-like metalloendopeptidase [Amphiura filiformis]|uniref:astacin-like metalloendopeptidase n=1 Tax=Amphiura filiformis TaxID=82378 RepID=UPI003B225EC7